MRRLKGATRLMPDVEDRKGPGDEECRWALDFERKRTLPRASQKEGILILNFVQCRTPEMLGW